MPAEKISIDKAKKNKLFYFVANAVVYRESDGRCLILKRGDHEIAHSGRYGVVGGKLEWEDLPLDGYDNMNGDVLDYHSALEKLLIREAFEEAGIEIYSDLRYVGSKAFIRPDEVPSVLLQVTARYKTGDVVLEENAFSDYAWVTPEEARNYPCIDGIPEELEIAVRLWQEKPL